MPNVHLKKSPRVMYAVLEEGYQCANTITFPRCARVEFTRVVNTYREALSRLETLWGGGNSGVGGGGGVGLGGGGGGGVGGSVGGVGNAPGPPPVHASHQRQLSLRSPQIQRRLIKNKSLLNAVEPAMRDRSLAVLLGILQRRVDHDKQVSNY
ncbi:hypothetical protein J437_LFUL011434 [Ladona fulva]|uniref:Uncharacterized protein n=1 Tax=Ladona fulva TaxID=123851 RepID=A0A8K0K103_LADFU|nr:hypothetical protein J437_LFUL011434 [Ladona fulva]